MNFKFNCIGIPMPQSCSHLIHVNRQFISKNAKDGKNRPTYTIKTKGFSSPRYATQVTIHGPSKLVAPGNQLSCGARAWIETDADITLENETTFHAVRADFD
jgi:hypothetical protein